jgi:hypothetical protein
MKLKLKRFLHFFIFWRSKIVLIYMNFFICNLFIDNFLFIYLFKCLDLIIILILYCYIFFSFVLCLRECIQLIVNIWNVKYFYGLRITAVFFLSLSVYNAVHILLLSIFLHFFNSKFV